MAIEHKAVELRLEEIELIHTLRNENTLHFYNMKKLNAHLNMSVS